MPETVPPSTRSDRRELAAAQPAQRELAGEHAAALREHERRDREVGATADAVNCEMLLLIWGRYVQAIKAARSAWDEVGAIWRQPCRPAPGGLNATAGACLPA
jgi:hypothetical protein